ncbi:unnamed protein product [Cladocopium goreaui]|nr:unnamed protein product [Cladocopium goreaui]
MFTTRTSRWRWSKKRQICPKDLSQALATKLMEIVLTLNTFLQRTTSGCKDVFRGLAAL